MAGRWPAFSIYILEPNLCICAVMERAGGVSVPLACYTYDHIWGI